MPQTVTGHRADSGVPGSGVPVFVVVAAPQGERLRAAGVLRQAGR
ncbi:hypothetical protein [Streptomyces caniscabiei]|nr:hypothetical protein [Streptomyces caniscabiei]